jgi:peptidyl-prolyl cis-trans isomerase C
MKKINNLLILGATVALLALPVMAKNIAVVNGTPISLDRYEFIVEKVKELGQAFNEEQTENFKNMLIELEVLSQEAKKKKLDDTKDYAYELETVKQQLLVQLLKADYFKKNPVTQEDIQTEYNTLVKAAGNEYKSRHILVEDEELANTLIVELKEGSDFIALAKEHSTDTGSGNNGGDLGWARVDTYVPEFANALQALEKGEMTEKPVKSQFGYHIIMLEDIRSPQLPPLSQVEPQIKQKLEQDKFTAYAKELREQATIK